MQIVYLEKLYHFATKHANARKSLATWETTTELAIWKSKLDVLRDFPKAKMIPNNRARFELVHNMYCLVAHIYYDAQMVVVRFIGTRTEYDRIDPATI